MVDVVNIVGALKKGKSNATYYFCEYSPSELNDIEIDDILLISAKTNVIRKQIELVVIEERDNRRGIVGIRINTVSGHRNIFIKGYEDIGYYIDEFVS